MKQWIEFSGVAALGLLTMLTAIPVMWPWELVVGAFIAAVIAIVIYCWAAISERRGGRTHYFRMTFLSVVLTLISLANSALQMEAGGKALLVILALCLLAAVTILSAKRYLQTRARRVAGDPVV